jgi:alcohol dehydrogenase class IV
MPDYVIMEPRLLETLPDYQKKSTLLDALSQCIESIWSIKSNSKSREHAKTGIQLILENLSAYVAGDNSANKNMMHAANHSGKAINISQTTAAHAMSYKLTSLYKISHGHSVALCLPQVWQFYISGAGGGSVPTDASEHITESLAIIAGLFNVKNSEQALARYNSIVSDFGLIAPRLHNHQEIEVLTNSVDPQRMSNSPLPLSKEDIRRMYLKILSPAPHDRA